MNTLLKSKGQRAHITIMFTDLFGSSRIASEMEPEIYSDLLERLRTEISRVSERKNGIIIRIDGDGFILIFGYPIAHDECTRQAIETALEIKKSLININSDYPFMPVDLHLRTAIHSGIVLVKEGDLKKGVYEILGDPTNTAAHLCKSITPGEIVISSETFGRSESLFEVSKETSLYLEKLSKKIMIRKVIGYKKSTSQTSQPLKIFIGRHNVFNWAENFIRSNDNSKKIALIHGEAGLGKTRFLNEFSIKMASKGFQIHQSICQGYLGSTPLDPIKLLLHSMKVSINTNSDNHIKLNQSLDNSILLVNQLQDSTDISDEKINEISHTVTTYFQNAGENGAFFVIDDWQWVDRASRALIERLIIAGVKNLKIILATRTRDNVFAAMHNASICELSPLSRKDIESQARSLIPNIGPFTLMRIQKYAGGNPLYLEELCHAINDSRFGFEDKKTGVWVESLIYTRFSQLPPPLVKIVKVAAVIGHIIPLWLLQETLEEPLTDIALKALEESDFIYSGEAGNNLRFKHGITQTAIYKMIGLEERIDIHTRVIDQFLLRTKTQMQSFPHAELAYHYKQSGKADLSIHHSNLAGTQALKSSSLDKAQAHFKNSLILCDKSRLTPAKRIALLNNYGRACVVDPSEEHLEQLEKILTSSIETADYELQVRSEYWLGFIFYGLGYPRRSIEHFKNCQKVATDLNDDKLLTQLKANLGQAYAAACEYDQAYKYLDEAIKVKFQHRSSLKASPSLAYAISCKGFALGEQGNWESANECFEKAANALAGQEHVANTSILNQKAVVNLWQGNIEKALSLTHETMEMSRRMHSRYNYAQSIFISSLAKFQKNQNDEYLSKMIQATSWLVFDGIGQNLSLNYAGISEALAIKKDWNRTRVYAARGLQRARVGDRRCESQILRALALCAKAGKTRYSAKYYMGLSYVSAEKRKSFREIENNRLFEKEHLTS